MQRCDVLVAGGGPAGSACAWKLRQAGLDVVVMDAAVFPRHKVCAGWITPGVVEALALDVDDYRSGRTFQPIVGFRTGLVDGPDEIETLYDRPVSYGVRRSEFDEYLLRRSSARLELGSRVTLLRRLNGDWIVNDAFRAPMVVGAGGHFCPIAQWLNGPAGEAPVVVAREAEFPIDHHEASAFRIAPEEPELYFCGDLRGYGWCFRKQDHINIGLGRLDHHSLPKACAAFVAFLAARRKVPGARSWPWRGHAYRLAALPRRRVVDAGLVLVGDAAGLAYPQSGEGIRPAIESGLLAAATILAANLRYPNERLEPYGAQLRKRFGGGPFSNVMARLVPSGVAAALAPTLLETPWFVRHVVLDRWFLHTHEPALAIP